MEDYKDKIKKLLEEHSECYQSLEKKHGYAPFSHETEWVGTELKGQKHKRDESSDREFKEIINKIYGEVTKESKYFRKDEKIKNYLLQRVWKYYQLGKKAEKWDEKQKSKYMKSHGGPNLIGEKKKITILAILYDYFLAQIIYLQEVMAKHSYFYKSKEFKELNEVINELNLILKGMEELPDFQKAKKKFDIISQKELQENYYNILKIDKVYSRGNKKGFSKLFTSDISKLPKHMQNVSKEEINKSLDYHSWKVAIYAKHMAFKIIDAFKEKNKTRRGLCGACAYLIAKEINPQHNFWITPKKSISVWAKFYGIDRTVFQKRINEITSVLKRTESS